MYTTCSLFDISILPPLIISLHLKYLCINVQELELHSQFNISYTASPSFPRGSVPKSLDISIPSGYEYGHKTIV
jgi:hypothetical protein